ncbi:MAG: TIM barrel protein [Bacteroidota bacterium]
MSTTRRDFLKASGGAGALLAMGDSFAQSARVPAAPGFSLTVLATNWGFDGSWDQFAAKAAASGYDGVEVWVPGDERDRTAFLEAMQKHKLKFGLLAGGGDRDPVKHLSQYLNGLETGLRMKPLYVNSHSGRDHFSFDQNLKFIRESIRLSGQYGIPVYHETHRGRILYSAPVSKSYLDAVPDLRLTLDISHWCNVHESLLEDQQETVALALSRTGHIHARVGHAEGPQVNDPRAPEWSKALNTHLTWWDAIINQKKKEGQPVSVLTEFGPADYMPALPYTRQPVADQWAINEYMMRLMRERYGK